MARTSIKEKTVKEETPEKKTRTRKKKDEEMPEFASLKEERAWLESKSKLEPWEQMRLNFLKQPVRAYPEDGAKKKVTKKAVAKRTKKVVKYENGEYFKTPKTVANLKTYITGYCKAMGWKDKKFKFKECPNMGFKDFKITADKDKGEVYLTGSLVFQTQKQMYFKEFKRVFTLENHRQIRDLIINTIKIIRKDWNNVKEVNAEEVLSKGWCRIYDML